MNAPLILPSHQLAFTLTMRLSAHLLEVCPYVRKVTALRTHHLLSTTCLHSKPEFSGVHSLQKMLPALSPAKKHL
jgi:hypothetical protein